MPNAEKVILVGADGVTAASATNPIPVSTESSGGTSDVNLVQVGGAAISEGQKTMAASLPVAIASNQSAVPVSNATQLPAALGQTTMAASLPVTLASNQSALSVSPPIPASIFTGQYKITASAVAISSSQALVNGLVIKARLTNTGSVWIGGSGVTTTDDGTGNGYKLTPGEACSFACNNANLIYAIGTANDVLYFEGN